jgi:hypothetical protein
MAVFLVELDGKVVKTFEAERFINSTPANSQKQSSIIEGDYTIAVPGNGCCQGCFPFPQRGALDLPRISFYWRTMELDRGWAGQ